MKQKNFPFSKFVASRIVFSKYNVISTEILIPYLSFKNPCQIISGRTLNKYGESLNCPGNECKRGGKSFLPTCLWSESILFLFLSLVTRQNDLLFLLNCLPVDGCCIVRYACT